MSTVTFQEGPLGIVLGQVAGLGLCVRKFQSGSEGQVMQAEATGQIQVHDVVVAINGVQVSENFTPAMLAGSFQNIHKHYNFSKFHESTPPHPTATQLPLDHHPTISPPNHLSTHDRGAEEGGPTSLRGLQSCSWRLGSSRSSGGDSGGGEVRATAAAETQLVTAATADAADRWG